MFPAKDRQKSLTNFGKGSVFGPLEPASLPLLLLFSRLILSGNVIRFLFDSNGRILSLLIDSHNVYFNVVNIYSANPASERKIFFF